MKFAGAYMLLTGVFAVQSIAASKSLLRVDLPELGSIRVEGHIVPDHAPRIRLITVKGTSLLGFTLGEAGPPEADSPSAPRVAAVLRTLPGMEGPLIIVAAASPHATAIMYEVAIVGVVSGKLQLLHAPWTVTNMGGIYVGELGPGNGVGVASWDFIWDNCHVCSHHYDVKLYPRDRTGERFSRQAAKNLRSRGAYDTDTEGLQDLGLNYTSLLRGIPEFKGF